MVKHADLTGWFLLRFVMAVACPPAHLPGQGPGAEWLGSAAISFFEQE